MLTGKKISLRIVKEKDMDLLYELHSDVTNRGDHFPLAVKSQPNFIKQYKETGFWSDDYGRLLIVNDLHEILGSIWYFKAVPYFNSLEIGYIIYSDIHRNKGIMTEALQLFTEYLFKAKTINRLELRIFSENQASEGVAKKCGYQFEGVSRKAVFHHGHNRDINVYSLIREDLHQKHK
jgi:[ribosomal protein S5]-alanine N-acetyltransferase